MKQAILVFIHLLITLSCYSQLEVKKDSITKSKEKNPLVIRCYSIFKSTSNHLFIVDGVPFYSDIKKDYANLGTFLKLEPEDINSIEVLTGIEAATLYGKWGKNGVVLITTKTVVTPKLKASKNYPFKIYDINPVGWNTTQDIYNAIQSKVPGASISSSNISQNQNPSIRLRGDDITVVIVDGVRYDASILNTLNPSDIEHIQVAPSAAATNYFRIRSF